MKRQLFIIPAETWDSLSQDEVNATVEAMRELDIFHLPYPAVDVQIPANKSCRWNVNDLLLQTPEGERAAQRVMMQREVDAGICVLRGDTLSPVPDMGFTFQVSNVSLEHDDCRMTLLIEEGSAAADLYRTRRSRPFPLPQGTKTEIAKVLIVLLATRNARKETKRDKLAKLGIGRSKHRHEYVTTITIPKVREDCEEHATTGKAKKAHLRRGHVRSQPYGPARSMRRKQWIEPIFVNADEDWVDTRKRYNVSL